MGWGKLRATISNNGTKSVSTTISCNGVALMLPSIIFLGLGSWVLTVPCTETLILGYTHLLVINSNCMTATRCGSSLSLCSPRSCPGPWPDETADAKQHHRPAKLSWLVGVSLPPANVVSARPKPNRLVRTKASTSVLKQVGTYLHMYCKRLSQLRDYPWSVPADR